jgi:hypothetical protein
VHVRYDFIGSRVETMRLQSAAVGQLRGSLVLSPASMTWTGMVVNPSVHGVALQVAFERRILKPVFSLDRL